MAERGVATSPARFRVVDPGGRPVSGAMLGVAESSVPFPEIALVADAQGIVVLRLPAGEFTLHAQGPGGESGEVRVTAPLSADAIVDIVVR